MMDVECPEGGRHAIIYDEAELMAGFHWGFRCAECHKALTLNDLVRKLNAAMQLGDSDAMMVEQALHDKGYPRNSTVRGLLRNYQARWRGDDG